MGMRSWGISAGLAMVAILFPIWGAGVVCQERDIDGAALFETVCANCHGKTGDGRGKAARYVFPRPRNLRHGSFRLVSTVSKKPSVDDIYRVIEVGIPGTSMKSWKELGKDKIGALVDHVIRIRREGATERIHEELRQEGGIASEGAEKTIADYVSKALEAGPRWSGPEAPPVQSNSVQRGKQVYLEQKCASCHGLGGRGSKGMDLVDQDGQPTWATDLVRGEFHGGREPQDIAARVYLGMPGSAMPSSSNLSPEDLSALVAYCLSLSAAPRNNLTNHQRRERAIGRNTFKNNSKSP